MSTAKIIIACKSDRESAHSEQAVNLVVIGLGVIMILIGLFFFVADGGSVVPTWARAIVLGVTAVSGLVLIAFGMAGRARTLAIYEAVRAEDAELQCTTGALSIVGQSGVSRFQFRDFRAVTTDRDYLSIGPIPTTNTTLSLFLLDDSAPDRPGLALRRRLSKEIRRKTVHPTAVDGVTIIPVQHYAGKCVTRLIEHALSSTRQN